MSTVRRYVKWAWSILEVLQVDGPNSRVSVNRLAGRHVEPPSLASIIQAILIQAILIQARVEMDLDPRFAFEPRVLALISNVPRLYDHKQAAGDSSSTIYHPSTVYHPVTCSQNKQAQ